MTAVKYMIMMFGDQATMLATRSSEWITTMIEFMERTSSELVESGELVEGQGLVDPSLARTVRIRADRQVVTDGPFAESKESLAGYWVLECDDARAIDVASRCVAVTGEPVEVRQVMDAPAQV